MIAPDVQIRPAIPTDVADLLRIAGDSPSAPQWTSPQYLEVLASAGGGAALRRAILLATSQAQVVGFAMVSAMCAVYPAEAELESLAVAPAFRRQGLGNALLGAVVAWSQAQQAGVLRLEVRAGNAQALRLYAADGFLQTGMRSGYYVHPVEDAVCMQRSVPSAAGEKTVQT